MQRGKLENKTVEESTAKFCGCAMDGKDSRPLEERLGINPMVTKGLTIALAAIGLYSVIKMGINLLKNKQNVKNKN